MDRRSFLVDSGKLAAFLTAAHSIPLRGLATRLVAADNSMGEENPNWVDRAQKATVKTSTYVDDPPWGYRPENIFGENLYIGWEAKHQTSGAWLEIALPEPRQVSEIWILPEPLERDIVGQDPYLLTYSRVKLLQAPRKIRLALSNGTSVTAELRKSDYFQIITLPTATKTSSLRITVDDVWPKAGGEETGLCKVRAFPRKHQPSFEIDVYEMYDVRDGKPVQTATVHLINPGDEVRNATLTISHEGKAHTVPLEAIAAQAVTHHDIWIPAPFDDTSMEFKLESGRTTFCCERKLKVPAYRTYFDGGKFVLDCTNHNDLGWLNTQEKTADYRSEVLILPAMDLLKKYPEFRYWMECTAYLMEFLDRHPEKRDEMAALMRENRFCWGASYVQVQEVHVGPEKLVRQFYLGRRWLKKTFPGCDTLFYVKTDPPNMTLQMPQLLNKAGIKYVIQGRAPFGFYNWESPDGSIVLTFAYHYVDPMRLLNPKNNQGWLRFTKQREYYYAPRQLPPIFIYDYTSDYLPPQPNLPPYAREQNAAMDRFAAKWNQHYAAQPDKQIDPPEIVFMNPEQFMGELSKHPLNITTLRGDWPFSWTYYDEPSNREGLLKGREAHNELLAAERLSAGLGLGTQFSDYPAKTFADAWEANCWPDHGWGGNQGVITDQVYNATYAKSKDLADELISGIGANLAKTVKRKSNGQIPVVVFNPLSWQRTDLVEAEFKKPSGWQGFTLRDDTGQEVPYEIVTGQAGDSRARFIFVAQAVPSVGYRTYFLQSTSAPAAGKTPLTGDTVENQFFRVSFGAGGIKSLYDKRQKWEVLRSGKFDAGEVLQFTAPGTAWEDPEIVTTADFDKTSNYPFNFLSFSKGAVRSTALREAKLKRFTLREAFHFYHDLDRVDMDLELLNWDGQKDRELRVAFPINLDEAQMSYEVPFGTVEMGKDEIDFTLLPPDPDTAFRRDIYGGDHPLRFREAINWIDASSPHYLGRGCTAASDCTVHLFRDESDDPVTYPLLQHVLLSTRKSLAWNPEYWYTQQGNHRYRMALLPHEGDWRQRYRDAIGFNYRLTAFVGSEEAVGQEAQPPQAEFLKIEPSNLIVTAMKKSEDDNRVVIRFYEAEGNVSQALIRLGKPVTRAWKTNLIEDDEETLQPLDDGSLQLAVKPWEIVTLKVST